MQTVTVNLGPRSYSIHIGQDTLASLGELLRESGLGGKCAVVTNPTVAPLYLDPVSHSLERSGFAVVPILIPDGEEYKNINSLSVVYDRLIAERFERKSSILALGGGVVGDLAGFAAATFLRGVPYVQVPTTLLAQVDSSIGGKTAINHQQGKNLIGAFYQPRLVVIDVTVLRSLPRRELVAGMAEVIKYGVISDAVLFESLEREVANVLALEPTLLIRIISACCSIKARVVEQDEREDDSRAVLNFGHTVGHALEAVTGYTRFLHGEAVGIGMACATAISTRRGFCDASSAARIRRLIQKAGLPLEIPADVRLPDLIGAIEIDKKSAAGKIKFVMCEGIGKTRFHMLSPEEIMADLASGSK
ncbi:MAG TPA: 3-dehydroquinate synthase [Candidatus Eisenbacteria bacterium]|nr:3-dehydroquinate synthase [Candidatus Eisenbacteria bacterium]